MRENIPTQLMGLPSRKTSHTAWTVALSAMALAAFAGNSILCRLALGEATIDPASYTAVRLISGALPLWVMGKFTAIAGPARARLEAGSPAPCYFSTR